MFIHLLYFYYIYSFSLCTYVYVCGLSQKTACKVQASASTVWVVGTELSHQAWRPVSLPTEPSHQLYIFF